ncbi:MAG TPA: PEP-CTERM sorting domain-containing protein [Candidatus Eisenbacteria bacterium]|nr:PEP-CTERM sorting domain-containing protein [Candidatus Eisenbacteria bacterium]
MLSLRTWRCFLLAAVMLTIVAVAIPPARASIIQPTPSLPPTAGGYTTGTVCVSLGPGVCVVGASLYGFTGTISTFDSSGQSVDSSITFTADVYTDNNGMPGTLIGPVTLGGPIGILYAGRMTDMDLGTFSSSLTELDLTGMFNGHSIEIMLNPNMTSSGPTTVMTLDIAAPDGEFQVSSFFDVFTELSLDHGQFVPGPQRTFTLMPIPEPGSISLLALGVAGVAGELRRRLRP